MLALKRLRVLSNLKRCIHIEPPLQGSKMPSEWDVSTGLERWQAIQWAKGNYDPFFMEPIKRGPGTKDCPNVIPSVFDKRMVGCICHPDATMVVWFWLHEGFPRRCNCNYWFVLERIEIPQIYEDVCPK